MKDYSYSELKDMQERAMERVKNMQQRAKETADAANSEFSQDRQPRVYQNYNEKPFEAPKSAEGRSSRPYHIKMPADIPKRESEYKSFNDFFERENTQTRETKNQQTKANLIESVLNEPDKAILFSLLLLLRAEGSDEALMMALLYIMS